MKKRWIAFLMAAWMLLSGVSIIAASFDDVTDAHDWAKADIESYAERAILAGDGQGRFFPDNSVTRAEFAKMLCLVFGLDKAEEISYADVEKDSWQYDYIAKTDAYTYTEKPEIYAPNKPATRAEIVYAIVKAAGFDAKETDMPFADVNETNPALLADAKTAYALGLLKGYPDNTFRPNASVTRAEVVVLLSRAEAALAEKPPVEEKPEEPSAGEPEKETAQNSVKVSPMETLCYIDNVKKMLHPKNDEVCLRLQFYVSGHEELHVLYVDEDVPIYDVNGTATTLKNGDVICVNTNLYGEVKQIRIIVRMDDANLPEPMNSETAFLNKLYVPSAEKWGYLEEGRKHEVYFGFLGEIKYEADAAKIFIYPSDGKRSSDAVRVIAVPNTATVITYTTRDKVKNHYGFETVDSFECYDAAKDDYGNIVWYSDADTECYQYVLVKTKNDVITDLVIISNQ